MDELNSIGRATLFGLTAGTCVLLALALELTLGLIEERQRVWIAKRAQPPRTWIR